MNTAQLNVISVLLDWLEGNLDQPLSLDDVAAKAGYSKWHLQRMFKYATGQNLGAYIRARRLSRAAVALRITSRSIMDIGYWYHFDSQQIFTRAFKRQFAQTPGSYRSAADWPFARIYPPINLGVARIPTPDFITLDETRLVGVTNSYCNTLEQIDDFFRQDIRPRLWHQYLEKSTTLPPMLYGLNRLVPSDTKGHRQADMIFHYTTACKPGQLQQHMSEGQPVVVERGTYAKFTYEGPAADLHNFIILAYGTAMPNLGLTRRQGHDIECFYSQSEHQCSTNCILHCEYLIPIRN
ncbi:helix-turn-helix domain-containing protein [Acerihabitans arboris]|uniref:Helix-turn-helix domain-containing protein n=1 Tax=Acerihabitans arboris TaxID=2691583 RepID=A0A845SCI9_9GAMM|nr:helix-turn-helix domain-containing protein [Acerihabitans arboris]NDL61619.1 helix-turn-helix domain-containing protein [Acerihabitans arboris]